MSLTTVLYRRTLLPATEQTAAWSMAAFNPILRGIEAVSNPRWLKDLRLGGMCPAMSMRPMQTEIEPLDEDT